ncbi:MULTISPECIES: winged helix-turn-helix domain-containing protein [unclassified Oceanispirochaeta]|uniref:winged helix-turn-helix domain-containing protein n=1 Tax=unclassified Oceanispirochaeta TaxID=2635722 RepID=UPI000E090E28|nr:MULTISPECIES: winged helix-turn-helix domain-containing protein [unclassified Oceanispirochaeta]MBF9015247.1 winged helix-turn-helix domain-containing protein [Oceanispirochaeta sp. M2]NPD71705.1 hypothetical protein [Oceanispirochaeta sp. M1]RDG32899.1 hypothetical protein DV872_06310 [Oceanispirochaeta sp. M1]
MPTTAEIVCIQLPPLIQIELKDKYPSWYDRCVFMQNTDNIPDSASLLIIPSILLLNPDQKKLYKNLIAFGTAGLLESSYLAAAKDYLKDPWDCSELIIRSSKFLSDGRIKVEKSEIYWRNKNFYINGELIHFTPVQSRLLKILFDNPNFYFDCKDFQNILPSGDIASENSLYVQIHHIRKILREKLPESYGKSITVKNSNRRGYILLLPVDNLCKDVDKL